MLAHEAARVARGDLAPVTLATHRQLLNSAWRPAIGTLALVTVRYSQPVKAADAHPRWHKDAIERQLAHGERDKIQAAYNHADYLPERRQMAQAWAAYCDSLRAGKGDDHP